MKIVLGNRPLGGSVEAMFSKSHAHRAMICAALCGSGTKLHMKGYSADMEATERCLTALGAVFDHSDSGVEIIPGIPGEAAELDCGESGSTLRFMLPVVCAMGVNASLKGAGRLSKRPLEPLLSQLKEHGVSFSGDALPFSLSGKLTGGRFTLPGDVSSQYITGLLLALPLVGGGEVALTSPLQSKGYVDMTVRTMADFGVEVTFKDDVYTVPGTPYVSPGALTVEGDWSNSAFWLCAGALGNTVTVTGLDPHSCQGDRAVAEILSRFGARVAMENGSYTVSPGALHGIEIDAANIPDLIPVLSVVAANADGVTVVKNAGRLRLKESDRLAAICRQITALGGSARANGDELIITGGRLNGGTVDSENDHRMVMSAAVAALSCKEPVTITDWQAVNKSYPVFFRDFESLGGEIVEKS